MLTTKTMATHQYYLELDKMGAIVDKVLKTHNINFSKHACSRYIKEQVRVAAMACDNMLKNIKIGEDALVPGLNDVILDSCCLS